jgi:hypothetical protein
MIADRLMAGPDRRIGRLCDKLSEASSSPVIYTRYVDDLTISAKFPIESGSTPKLVLKILKGYGFEVNPDKSHVGRLSDVRARVTKLRIHRGKVDVSPEFVALVDRQIRDSALLAAGQDAAGPYYTPQQIFGRIQFIGWVNEGRLGTLLRDYNLVDWERVESAALERGLVVCRKQLGRKRRNTAPPE